MSVWRERAGRAWQDFADASVSRSLRGPRVHEPGQRKVVFAWPLSAVLHASALLEWADAPTGRFGSDNVWRSLSRYRKGRGFADTPLTGKRYYDDNAWLGLASAVRASSLGLTPVAQTWWRRAEDSMRFVSRGMAHSGGFRWVEGGTDLHACSTGGAGLLAAALEGAPRGIGQRWAPVGVRAAEFLDHELLDDDGLVCDHVSSQGEVDPAVFSYNQGLAISLRTWSGDEEAALELARHSMTRFDQEGLWNHAAAFNMVLFRALLRLSTAVSEQTRLELRAYMSAYLDRLWAQGRDDRGLFTRMHRYDSGVVLDHTAITGFMAAFSMDDEDLANLW